MCRSKSHSFRSHWALESLSAINLKTDSITSCVESYNNSLSELIDRLAPQKTRSVVVKPSSPWMTEEIHAAKCLKRRLERKWRRTKSDYDRKAYTKQRQVVARMIEHSKTEYYSQCVSECVGNQKRLFTITDRLMHRKKEPVLPDTTCDLPLAQKFSQFYSDKIIKIREDIDKQDVYNTDNVYSVQTNITHSGANGLCPNICCWSEENHYELTNLFMWARSNSNGSCQRTCWWFFPIHYRDCQ